MWPTAYIWAWNVADHLKMRTTSIFPCRHFNLPLPSIPLSLRNNCLKLKIPRKLPITNESVEVWDFRKITHHTWTSWGSKCQGTYPSQMNRLSLRNNRVEVQDFMKNIYHRCKMSGMITCIYICIPNGHHFPFPYANANARNHWPWSILLLVWCTSSGHSPFSIILPNSYVGLLPSPLLSWNFEGNKKEEISVISMWISYWTFKLCHVFSNSLALTLLETSCSRAAAARHLGEENIKTNFMMHWNYEACLLALGCV